MPALQTSRSAGRFCCGRSPHPLLPRYNRGMVSRLPSETAELTRRVRLEARRLGFDLVGVTTPNPPPHLDVYERWLGAGHHGEMHYMATERARERRADPRRILPECRSILVTATNYLPPAAEGTAEVPEMQVAAYAVGDDYHDTLYDRMATLVAYLEAEVGAPIPHRIYTDTGPLLERELAQRAGLGWIGKNTCLIHPEQGSYLLLAEALLGIELEPDPAFEADRCGSCTRCIDACPTACILPDRTIDARRCISYLNIELKGAIEPELREDLGAWLFGCDICQDVCPWNLRFAHPTNEPAFLPRPILQAPQLDAFLRLDQQTYAAELKGSPLKRPRLAGLLRNAAVVAGNSGKRLYANQLAELMRTAAEPIVRQHAAWALGQIGGSVAQAALADALSWEQDQTVRTEIGSALQRLESGADQPG